MINLMQKIVVVIIATAAFSAAMLWNGTAGTEGGLVSVSEARVGRPLTPMSYAGVARRTTRRAVAVGAAATGAYVATRPGCVQTTNAYGQVITRC